jgi:hypothetical protein
MSAFEVIAEADYDEPLEDLLDWLDKSTNIPKATDSPIEIVRNDSPKHPSHDDTHPFTSSGPSVMQTRDDSFDIQNQVDPNQFGSRGLAAHCQYISYLYHGLLNATNDTSAQTPYVEGIAAALLEFSTPEMSSVVKDIGNDTACSLLDVIQQVRLDQS